jgi:isoaspartyl peptidase/L-asparaginase-like protein (Ntn-hydrolase superfamily)
MKRRDFLKNTAIVAAGSALASCDVKTEVRISKSLHNGGLPIVISTWNHGIEANKAAMKVISDNGKAIDAVEAGVRVPESDPEMMSVGYGGLPDRDGMVTLDACIMDETGNCGAVSYLQHIKNPISVARKVMDETPHVMLSGKGALDFALEKGFTKENLLTKKARDRWEEWLKTSQYKPIVNIENHDTIGMLAIDNKGDISGACTTSGMAWKLHGRVGDSPIIGAGMFVDNEVGGACATGVGEMVMKTLGSFLIVELMRQGMNPQEACEEAVHRIVTKQDYKDMQVGYLAIDKEGNYGSYAIHPGFNYALYAKGENKMHDVESYVEQS